MPPNKGEGLLKSHPWIVPSPSEPSNKEPAFDRAVDHTEDFQGGPFPEQNFQVNGHCIVYKHDISKALHVTLRMQHL